MEEAPPHEYSRALQDMIQQIYQIQTGKTKVLKTSSGTKVVPKKTLEETKFKEFYDNSEFASFMNEGYLHLYKVLNSHLVNRRLIGLLIKEAYGLPYTKKTKYKGKTVWEASKEQFRFFYIKNAAGKKINLPKKTSILIKTAICLMMRWYQVNYIPGFTYYKELSIRPTDEDIRLFDTTDFRNIWKLKEGSNNEYQLSKKENRSVKQTKARREGISSSSRLQSQADLESEFYCHFKKSWEQDSKTQCIFHDPTLSLDHITPIEPCQSDRPCVMGSLSSDILKYSFGQHTINAKGDGPEWYPFRRGVSSKDTQVEQLQDCIRFLLQDRTVILPEGTDSSNISSRVSQLGIQLGVSIELIRPTKSGIHPHPVGALGKKKARSPGTYIFIYLTS